MAGNLAPSDFEAWPEPNYIDPERREWMPAYALSLQAASSVAVILRLWLRARKQAGPFGVDDALILPAWLSSIAFTTFILLSTEKYGSAAHVWDTPPQLFEPLTMAGWINENIFMITTCCTKCSVLFFYRRLTKGSYNRLWKYAILVAVGFTVCYSVAFIILLACACSPTEAYWKSKNPTWDGEYTCIDSRPSNLLSGIISVVSDFYSVLLPCLMLWNFEAPRAQKIALNVIFCLGLLVTAAGSVRTYYLHQLGHTVDLTTTGFDAYIWSQLEVQLAIICASAPALRVFFRKYLSDPMIRVLSSVRSHSYHDSHSKSNAQADVSSEREGSPIPLTHSSGNREKYERMLDADNGIPPSRSTDTFGHVPTEPREWDTEHNSARDSHPPSAVWTGKRWPLTDG
ncbi:hypothetical protein Q7P37_007336 [Cladosporium fusiforme]